MITYTQEQMQAIVDEIKKETDRGAAILAATIIDNILENLITARLIESPKSRTALFEHPNAPLHNLYAKIELGFALGLFTSERRKSLHLIRRVRNKFAHRVDAAYFDFPEIATIVENGVPQKVKEYTTMSARQKFLFTCNTLIIFLCIAVSFPQIRLKALDDEPAYHQYFDAVNTVIRDLLLEKFQAGRT
jgi:hypothetical protein